MLSQKGRQGLNKILRSTTPYVQRLVWNALRKIGPERAEVQLAPLSEASSYDLQVMGQIYGSILQVLPANYRQAFVNGLFQSSPEG